MVALLMTRLPEVANPERKPYPSDLSDAEWDVLKPLVPVPKGFGHPVEVDFREILNGIFYVQRTGCQWEMMPHDLPPYTTVYGYFKNGNAKASGNKCTTRSANNSERN
jgi:putative transposase